MANEANFSVQFGVNKNNARMDCQWSGTFDVSGNYFFKKVLTIGTSDETVTLDDVGTPGTIFIHNLDGTNFVLAGADGTNYPIKAKAGRVTYTGWNGAAIHLKADTAACKVEIGVSED